MNLAYYRKSTVSFDETVKNLKEALKDLNHKILIDTDKMVVASVCNNEWLDKLLNAETNVIGLIPCLVTVLKKNNEVWVGSGIPSVMAGITPNPAVHDVAQEMEKTLKTIIHTTANVEELKVKEVKLYSTHTCPYCKMEKEWLETNNIDHEVIYLEQNPFAAQRIMQQTGQQGVPVTEIIYDDNTSEFIIGFNKEHLKKVLNIG